METHKGATYSHRIHNIIGTMNNLFGFIPDDLDTFALASQITQAEGLKFFMERARSLKFDKMTGMLIWNLLDGWPQFSDAVVDYYFTPKLAYHALARVQEPVVLLFREPRDGRLELVCANDTLSSVGYSYRVTNVTHGHVIAEGESITAANVTASVCSVPYTGDDAVVYLIEWTRDGKSYRNHYVSGKAPLNYDTVLDGYRKIGLLDLYVK